jgi:hypothetical protein
MVLRDFVNAAKNIGKIKPKACRNWAVSQYSTDAVAPRYARYFGRLSDLWKKGWGELD